MSQLSMSMFANKADLAAARKAQTEVKKADRELTADQLSEKYNPEGEGEHFEFTRADWRDEVAEENVLSGYWVWVVSMLEKEGFENDDGSRVCG